MCCSVCRPRCLWSGPLLFCVGNFTYGLKLYELVRQLRRCEHLASPWACEAWVFFVLFCGCYVLFSSSVLRIAKETF